MGTRTSNNCPEGMNRLLGNPRSPVLAFDQGRKTAALHGLLREDVHHYLAPDGLDRLLNLNREA